MATYRQTLERMFELQKFGIKFGLDSMNGLLSRLGDPHRGLRCVHLAGTNGKGSTAAMLASVLTASGRRTGLYTSPHLTTFRERIKIDDEMIDEGEVIELAREVWEAVKPQSPPTFFEFVTTLALIHFRRRQIDLAVVECGLGGRLDSTNVLTPLVSGVTNVSLEHTEHLGSTIREVAWEKAGVIKPGVPFVGGRLSEEALAVAKARAAELDAPLRLLGRDYKVRTTGSDVLGRPSIDYQGVALNLQGLQLGLAGLHQADNAAMALALAEALNEVWRPASGQPDRPLTEEAVRRGLSEVSWPGRAEFFAPGAWPPDGSGRAPLLLDGAHNPGGAAALAAFLPTLGRRRLHLILGVMADKDVAGVLGPLTSLADRLHLTRPAYHRAADPETLLTRLTATLGPPTCPVALHQTIPEALAAAASQAEAEDLTVLSGSLFTVGEARAHLTGVTVVDSN
ncbi:MAG: bifunctional folylpolyglutamate synthase/dihydrofolate synthase [Deltaproteobacteria bacterium]|jgi:dihydrofolate synthase/folylpolyglutamate synthase|nr:bifunctional folylpolyglutamate synthase/dihydrofolate synthase [Deltaproteobacteria bacterium]